MIVKTRVSDILRTKSLRWRVAYLIIRTVADLIPPILVLSGVGWYVGSGAAEFRNDDSDVVVFLFESMVFAGLCRLQFVYELPFLMNQYGLRNGGMKRSFFGFGLEQMTEWRNKYILYLFIYKLCFFIRLLCGVEGDLILIGVVFDYLFQYILVVGFWIVRSLVLKFCWHIRN